MRILEVCPYGMDRPGGVQGQVLAIANALSRRGHEVTVAAPRVIERVEFASWDLGCVGEVSANNSRAPIGISPWVGERLREAMKATGAQVAHVHEPLTPLVGPAACGLRGPFLVATFHRGGGDGWYRAYAAVIKRWRPVPSCAVAVSSVAAATARSVGVHIKAIIPNGVDPARFGGAQQREPGLFLFAGRHEPRKGLDVLLRAWKLGMGRGPARLVVLGEGPQSAKLRVSYGGLGNVEFLGRLCDQETARWMERAEVVVVPSTGGESFGVVLVEAMTAGAVVVASSLASYRDVLGGAGKYFEPGNAQDLARCLQDVAQSRELRATLREKSLSRATRFGIDSVTTRYEEMFEQGVIE